VKVGHRQAFIPMKPRIRKDPGLCALAHRVCANNTNKNHGTTVLEDGSRPAGRVTPSPHHASQHMGAFGVTSL
ncbi:hypothetical protein, partial [Verticiella alkaliphila]|uniref:hypothetical protein n=1 Tax=Verticiella alkaliphila TaxID=2779529 RepID=UPI001C0AA034